MLLQDGQEAILSVYLGSGSQYFLTSSAQITQGSRSTADSDSVGQGWAGRSFPANKLPEEARAAGPRTRLGVARMSFAKRLAQLVLNTRSPQNNWTNSLKND